MRFDLAFWLSMVLAAGSAYGMRLAGKQRSQGWLVALALQPVWAVFAIVTRGYGLLVTVVIYTYVYYQNLRGWRQAEKVYRYARERGYGARGTPQQGGDPEVGAGPHGPAAVASPE